MKAIIVAILIGVFVLCGLSSKIAVSAGPYPALPDSVFVSNDTFAVLPPATYWIRHLPANTKPSSIYYRELAVIRKVLIKAVNDYNNRAATKRWKEAINSKGSYTDSSYFFIEQPVYRVQLVPYTDSIGQKQVWVNCFAHYPPDKDAGWSEEFPDWKQHRVFVYDGGKNYFNFKINLSTNSYYDFEVNGEA